MMGVGRCVVRGVLTWMMGAAKFRLLQRKFGPHAILGLLFEPIFRRKNLKFQFLDIGLISGLLFFAIVEDALGVAE